MNSDRVSAGFIVVVLLAVVGVGGVMAYTSGWDRGYQAGVEKGRSEIIINEQTAALRQRVLADSQPAGTTSPTGEDLALELLKQLTESASGVDISITARKDGVSTGIITIYLGDARPGSSGGK